MNQYSKWNILHLKKPNKWHINHRGITHNIHAFVHSDSYILTICLNQKMDKCKTHFKRSFYCILLTYQSCFKVHLFCCCNNCQHHYAHTPLCCMYDLFFSCITSLFISVMSFLPFTNIHLCFMYNFWSGFVFDTWKVVPMTLTCYLTFAVLISFSI